MALEQEADGSLFGASKERFILLLDESDVPSIRFGIINKAH